MQKCATGRLAHLNLNLVVATRWGDNEHAPSRIEARDGADIPRSRVFHMCVGTRKYAKHRRRRHEQLVAVQVEKPRYFPRLRRAKRDAEADGAERSSLDRILIAAIATCILVIFVRHHTVIVVRRRRVVRAPPTPDDVSAI